MGKGNASLNGHKALDGAREGAAGIFPRNGPNKCIKQNPRLESAFDS
ncbi:hypothetical protein VQ042_04450 [Aurantimonas sp. A2-1-M11]